MPDELTEASAKAMGRDRCQAITRRRGNQCRHRDGGTSTLVNAVGKQSRFCPDHARAALEGYVLSNCMVSDWPYKPNEWQIVKLGAPWKSCPNSLSAREEAEMDEFLSAFEPGKTGRPPENK